MIRQDFDWSTENMPYHLALDFLGDVVHGGAVAYLPSVLQEGHNVGVCQHQKLAPNSLFCLRKESGEETKRINIYFDWERNYIRREKEANVRTYLEEELASCSTVSTSCAHLHQVQVVAVVKLGLSSRITVLFTFPLSIFC